jgi:hypothetical protein
VRRQLPRAPSRFARRGTHTWRIAHWGFIRSRRSRPESEPRHESARPQHHHADVNAEAWLAEAIRSAQLQTLPDIEILVIDDGSTDASWEIAQRFMADSRVRGIRQQNHGIAGARNSGLSLARGEFVAFLDADDRWLPEKAARHVAQLQQTPWLDASFSWYRVIDALGRDTGRRGRCRPGSFSLPDLLIENFVWNGQPVLRRAATLSAGSFDTTLPSHEDFEYILRIASLRPRNIACIPEVLAEYRRRPGQLTADWTAMHAGFEAVMTRMRAAEPQLVQRVAAEATARHYRFLAYLAWEAGQFSQARRFLRRAWRAQPFALARDRRAWLTTAAVAATLLPAHAHSPLRRSAERMLERYARTTVRP